MIEAIKKSLVRLGFSQDALQKISYQYLFYAWHTKNNQIKYNAYKDLFSLVNRNVFNMKIISVL